MYWLCLLPVDIFLFGKWQLHMKFKLSLYLTLFMAVHLCSGTFVENSSRMINRLLTCLAVIGLVYKCSLDTSSSIQRFARATGAFNWIYINFSFDSISMFMKQIACLVILFCLCYSLILCDFPALIIFVAGTRVFEWQQRNNDGVNNLVIHLACVMEAFTVDGAALLTTAHQSNLNLTPMHDNL